MENDLRDTKREIQAGNDVLYHKMTFNVMHVIQGHPPYSKSAIVRK